MPRPIYRRGTFNGRPQPYQRLIHASATLHNPDPHRPCHPSPCVGPRKNKAPTPPNCLHIVRDIWPSREVAAKSFASSPFYRRWDSRVLDRWITHGLRDLPTLIHPDTTSSTSEKQVTLTTSKNQEVFTFLRPNYEGYGVTAPINRTTHADLDPSSPVITPFYRSEGISAYNKLPSLRPSVLYVFGSESDVGKPDACEAKMKYTGIGVSGSGGAAMGRVKSVTYEGVGHLIAMEAVKRTADDAAGWIGSEMKRFREEQEEYDSVWRRRPRLERQMVDERWKEAIGGPAKRPPKKKESNL